MDDCDSWKCAKAFVKGAGSRMLLCFLPHCLISSSEHVFLSCPSSPGFPPPSSDWHRNRKLCGPTSSLIHRACPGTCSFVTCVAFSVSVCCHMCLRRARSHMTAIVWAYGHLPLKPSVATSGSFSQVLI